MALAFGIFTALVCALPNAVGAAEGELAACAPSQESIDATKLPSTVDLDDCPVDGRALVDGAAATVLPEPGEGVYAEALTTDGPHELLVTRTSDGTIELTKVGVDLQTAQTPPSSGSRSLAATDGCDDAAFESLRYKVGEGKSYRVNRRTTPKELTQRNALSAIRKGTANIVNTANPCGLGDRVPVGFAYEGKTRRLADIAPDKCTDSDDRSVASFGKLPKGTLAVTCTTFSDGTVNASDMELNDSSIRWTTNPGRSCQGEVDLESVVTHERGHTFGLGHVSEETHGSLTMSVISEGFCQAMESSLGRGDVLGLDSKYP